jgi:Zn-finger nucleic acid-binding protein
MENGDNGSGACPRCETAMETRKLGQVTVTECPDGHGVFLDRADLGSLVEAENDWHTNASQNTAALPRITPDMSAPPATAARARAWVETLFS